MAVDTVVVEDKGMILNGWQRSGGCHADCGACCKYLMLPIDPERRPGFVHWDHWVKAHGIEIIGSKVRVPLPCQYLTWDNQCAVYDTEERPKMCVEGPRLPEDIKGLEDRCTYQWRRVDGKPN